MLNNDDFDDSFQRYDEDLEGGEGSPEMVDKSDIKDRVPRKEGKDKGCTGCFKRFFVYMYPAMKKTVYTK
mgnify:CR=1 FL=1